MKMTSKEVVEDRGKRGLRVELRRRSGTKSIKTYMQEWENDANQSCTLFCNITAEQMAAFVACFEMAWCTFGFLYSVGSAYYSQLNIGASEKQLPNSSYPHLIVTWLWLLGLVNSCVLWSGVTNRSYAKVNFWYTVTSWVVVIRFATLAGCWLSRYGNPCELLPTLIPEHVPKCHILWSNIYMNAIKVPDLHVYTLHVSSSILMAVFEMMLVKIVLKYLQFFKYARRVVSAINKVRSEQQPQPQNAPEKQGAEIV